MLDERVLEEKLTQLERARAWPPRLVSKLEALLRSSDETHVFRVDPLAFAAERQVREDEAIDLFLHAARCGLFQMDWQLVCPSCSDAIESTRTLGSIGRTFHCDLCRVDLETSLDDAIQVTFTVAPLVRPIAFHAPESLPIEDYCLKYHFSTRARTLDGRPYTDVVRALSPWMTWVEPGETRELQVVLHPGRVLGSDRIHRAEYTVRVEGEGGGGPLSLRLADGAWTVEPPIVPPGPTSVTIENRMSRKAAVMCINVGPGRAPSMRAPLRFLTGKRLFVTDTFRDLFQTTTVRKHGGLALKDLTIVFTDLKGSTELYDRIGDLGAFQLVEQHFDHLAGVVRSHHGAIVKTIGDAIMATFACPADGVGAAIDMLAAIDAFNRSRGNRDVTLKIGVHRGASIAVTLNDRLDYFGQTVNIAARVQGLADGDEICMTEGVHDDPGVRELLAGRAVVGEAVRLKGIARPLTVFRHRIEPGSR